MKSFSIVLILGVIAAALTAFAGEDAKKAPEVKQPFFGNATCPTSGEKTDPSIFLEKDGQRVYFCCKKCQAGAEKDVAAAMEKAYPKDKVVAAKNKTCPVMGEAIDADAKTVNFQGHAISVCCAKCSAALAKAPDHFLTLATDANVVALNNKTCPMSGKAVDKAFCLVIDGVLVDFCCANCKAATQKDAAAVLKKANIDLDKVKADAKKKS
jgi:hypothetical protein